MHAKTDRAIQIMLVVAVFGGWQAGVTAGVIDPFFFPAPWDIVRQMVTW